LHIEKKVGTTAQTRLAGKGTSALAAHSSLRGLAPAARVLRWDPSDGKENKSLVAEGSRWAGVWGREADMGQGERKARARSGCKLGRNTEKSCISARTSSLPGQVRSCLNPRVTRTFADGSTVRQD